MTRTDRRARQALDNDNRYRTIACYRAFEGQCEGDKLTDARAVLHSVDMVLRQRGISPLFAYYEDCLTAVSFKVRHGTEFISCWATETTLTIGGRGAVVGTLHSALHGLCDDIGA